MTAAAANTEREKTKHTRRRRDFGNHVAGSVARLQEGYVAQPKAVASATAAMARLRGTVDQSPGSSYDVLGETRVPERLLEGWAGDEPTPRERAKHAAMALYATHQQSVRETRMHVDGVALGEAVNRLANKPKSDGSDPAAPRAAVLRRFAALGTAATYEELVHHLRSLVRQLRDERIALDYGLLADDLERFQRPAGPDEVRALWGRDFYRIDVFERTSTPEEEPQS
jgi:CRISPR system Cascade subunit CasB